MHSSKRLAAAALAVALAAPGAAYAAAVLHTPPAFQVGLDLFCQLRNVGRTPMDVTIDNLAFGGEVLDTYTTTLAPGQAASNLAAQFNPTSCRFTVSGSARNVRGVALYWDGTDYTLALTAR